MNRCVVPMVLTLAGVFAGAAFAHDGRRFDIQIVDGQLFAQGYLSGANPTDDGGGIRRPFYNAIHGHFENLDLPGIDAARATLPGFDLFQGGELTGFDLTLTLNGAVKWVSPPMDGSGMVPDGTIPSLVPLDPGEEIVVGLRGSSVSTQNPGSLTLIQNISPSGLEDIDLTYDIADNPADVIYALDLTLSTDAPGIRSSESVFAILSPDGVGKIQRLHYASLALEEHLGIPVPAPSSGLIAGVGLALAARRRR